MAENDGSGWQEILGTDSPNYNPSNVATTTAYRRLARASYSGDLCEEPSNIFISNTVTITVQPGPSPIADLRSGLPSNTVCAGTNSITLDASLSTDASSFLFFVNGNPIITHPQQTQLIHLPLQFKVDSYIKYELMLVLEGLGVMMNLNLQ